MATLRNSWHYTVETYTEHGYHFLRLQLYYTSVRDERDELPYDTKGYVEERCKILQDKTGNTKYLQSTPAITVVFQANYNSNHWYAPTLTEFDVGRWGALETLHRLTGTLKRKNAEIRDLDPETLIQVLRAKPARYVPEVHDHVPAPKGHYDDEILPPAQRTI